MKSDQQKSHFKANPVFMVFWVTAILFLSGCASVSQIIEKTKKVDLPFASSQKALKKKVGITPVEYLNRAEDRHLSKELASLVMENLTSKCTHSTFVSPNHSLQTLFLEDLPKSVSGETDNQLLAQMGRNAGLNAVVAMDIGGIAVENKKSGLIGFRKNRKNVRIWVKLEVYDTHTGAKLLFDGLSAEIELDENEIQAIDAQNLSASPSVMKAMAAFSKTIGKDICKTIASEPWKAFVISVENGKAFISSGLDAGIQVGDVFALYDIGKTIDNIGAQRFRMPGKMVGEIKITSVAADRSEGVSVSGAQIQTDSLVRIKED